MISINENGEFRGRTEATLEGISTRLDEAIEQIGELRREVVEQKVALASMRTSIKTIMFLAASSIAAVTTTVIEVVMRW